MFRLERQRILIQHLTLINIALDVLQRAQQNQEDLCDKFMEINHKFETKQEYALNRRLLLPYFRRWNKKFDIKKFVTKFL